MTNRLQFRFHDEIFNTREEAIEYIYSQIRFAESGLASEDQKYGFSLLAEPTILRYKNELDDTEPSGSVPSPHVILAIGSNTNPGTQYNDNRFCIIDIDKTEAEIADLWEELEKAIAGLTIITKDTNTLKLYSEKTDEGTVISGDVAVASSHIFHDLRKPNIILNTEDGLFTYVGIDYDRENDKIFFTVNGDTQELPINNNYLVRGYYSKRDESLHLIRKDEADITISLENLIDEWGVEGEASNTPIVLTREEVGYGDEGHSHVEPWQDVLRGDIRLADRRYNILKKTSDGRYLYVDGLANNITFFKDGQEMTVQDALASATKGVSNDSTNIIYEKADGYYSTASLKYNNRENKLIFTTSNVTGGTSIEEIHLNSVEAFTKVYYDPVTENLIILYKDGSGDLKEVDIPIGEMMTDWEWDIVNEGHNVKLHKQRVIAGNDKVSADVAIFEDSDNILVDRNHELFVKGTADNIKYSHGTNVSDELDKLNANDSEFGEKLDETIVKVDTLRSEFNAEVSRATSEEARIEGKLNQEITRSTDKDNEHDSKISTIEQTIGNGFSIDGHETITYKFNELSAKTNVISAKTDTIGANLDLLSAKTEAEIVRANGEEQRIEKKFDDEIGDGFNIRNTVRDEFNKEKAERIGEDTRLQAEIDALSASTEGKLMDIINIDHSIGIDKSDAVRPIVNVNLSEEIEDNKPNIIKLNADGIYAGVDLNYYFDSETGKNLLVFKTTNGTKTFDIKTNSVIDKIYYDPTREAIIIEYTVDGHRMPDVVVPVHDLINEWRVSEDTNGAIKLYKFRDSGATQDVLYAESIISNHEDNILVNDNGALYVSGAQIEQNTADIASLKDRMDTAEADIDALEDGLNAEIDRAKGEEQRIEDKLDREIERSTNEDDEIWRALRAEITRSTDKDNEHDTRINNEIQRATTAERDLHDEIVSETTRAISAETALNDKINNEITRATSEEARIEGKLDQEITRSTNKDSEHDTKINELRSDLNNEINDRANADHILEGLIHSEEDRAKTAESAITQALIAETTARENGDATLDQKIDTEIANRQTADETLDDKISNEINRATSEETRIENKLDAEITRSTNKDNDLQQQITNEAATAREAESAIREALTTEISNRQTADANLQTQITNEVTRAQGAENALDVKIEAEKNARETEDEHIWAKIRPIEFYDTTTVHNERVRNNGETPDEVRHYVIVSQSDKNIVVADDTKGGVYATASLEYDTPTNSIILKGTDGIVLSTQQLGPGSLLDDISYDYVEKDLVIQYHSADGTAHTLKFPVSQLFNEWEVQNPSEGSAIELHKETNSGGTGNVDILWGKVLLTRAVEYPDGTVDYGDNIIRIVNNGLYASGSAITEALRISQCATHELRTVEEAVIGSVVSDSYPCGSGYTYTPFDRACFISAATSMYDADKLLDKYLCSAHTRITDVEVDVDCLWDELNVTQENVIGIAVPECGLSPDGTPFAYPKHLDACFISAATSLDNADTILDEELCKLRNEFNCISGETKMTENVLGIVGNCDEPIAYPTTQGCLLSNATTFADADAILEDAVCKLMNGGVSGIDTPTTTMNVEVDPSDVNKKTLSVDVKLSHGNSIGEWQSDSDLVITNYSGDCIETSGDVCLQSEFTNTNVLRIVDLTSIGVDTDSEFNGLYLSNVWDCGKYTENGTGTPGEKYRTDESPSAQNIFDRKFRNGVRYHN